jgi:hypothetical protein
MDLKIFELAGYGHRMGMMLTDRSNWPSVAMTFGVRRTSSGKEQGTLAGIS